MDVNFNQTVVLISVNETIGMNILDCKKFAAITVVITDLVLQRYLKKFIRGISGQKDLLIHPVNY